MKKKQLLVVLTVMMTAALTGCGSYKVALSDTNPVHVELGSELSSDVKDYITVTKGEEIISEGEVFEDITVDTSTVDTSTLGTYSLVITYQDNEIVVPIVVEDTTAPVIKVKDLELEVGTEVSVDAYVTATDLEEVDVYFVLEDGTETKSFTYGGEETEVKVIAEDAAGNTSEATFQITPVQVEEVEEAQEEVVTGEAEKPATTAKAEKTGTTTASATTGTTSTTPTTGNSSTPANNNSSATTTPSSSNNNSGSGSTGTANTPATSTPSGSDNTGSTAATTTPGSSSTANADTGVIDTTPTTPPEYVDVPEDVQKDLEIYSARDPMKPAVQEQIIDDIMSSLGY